MIDIDKIEADARAAPYETSWRYEPTGQTVWAGNTYMVADIRGWGHLQHLPNGEALQDATGVHIAAANRIQWLEAERDELSQLVTQANKRIKELERENAKVSGAPPSGANNGD